MLTLNTSRLYPIFKYSLLITVIAAVITLLSACNRQQPPEKTTVWPTISHCDLHHQECITTYENQTVQLKISPNPIPIARPLGIELSLKNFNESKVELDISGANMYMGYNRVNLIQDGPKGRYIGTSMLAFCSAQKMTWKITLIIHLKDGSQIQIPYLLETQIH